MIISLAAAVVAAELAQVYFINKNGGLDIKGGK